MFRCFICHMRIEDFPALKKHVSKDHLVSSIEHFTCNQNGCQRTYNCLKTLFRHMRNKHTELFFDVSDSHSSTSSLSLLDSRKHNELGHTSEIDQSLPNVNETLENSRGLTYVLNLCSLPNLTRKDIIKIIGFTKDIVDQTGNGCIDFSSVNSDYLIQKTLKARGLLLKLNSMLLGYEDDDVIRKGINRELVQRPVSGYYFFIKDLLLKIFSYDSLITQALLYMNDRPNCFMDLKNGTNFANIPGNHIPFILFYDEVECGNALGSHRGVNKVGVIQLSLKCFPPHFNSKLENLFILSVFPTTDKHYLKEVINRLSAEINELHLNPVIIKGIEIVFHFRGFVGDNLGLHQIFGFGESFSSNYFCRFCKIHRNSARFPHRVNNLLRRTKETFTQDLDCRNFSETGVKYNSNLNNIKDFHVVENCFVDVMHDVLEGVCKFGLISIIKYYVENEVFTLEEFNSKVRLFPFKSSKPPFITKLMLLNEDLAYSASEVLHLVNNLNLIIGEEIDESCPVWEYFCTLRSLVDSLIQKSFCMSELKIIEENIFWHNALFVSVFKKQLKPKHHFLIHYPECMLKNGPMSLCWGMRFEGKHRLLKMLANVNSSKINLCKTLLIRYSLVLAHDIYKHKLFDLNLELIRGRQLPYCNTYKSVEYKGINFSIGDIVWFKNDYDLVPIFGEINEIFFSYNKCFLKLLLFNTLAFHQHLQCFVIRNNLFTYENTDISHVSSPLIYVHRKDSLFVNFMKISFS